MSTDQSQTDRLIRAVYPAAGEAVQAWAHVSGWAQLTGHRRTLSCVLMCANHASHLNDLLPDLSDVLTECGYPWEVIVVDSGSRDRSDAVVREWCELPGFRAIMLSENFGRGTAAAAGLQNARGDGVLLLYAAMAHPLNLVPQMVMEWDSGAEVIYAVLDAERGESALQRWQPSSPTDESAPQLDPEVVDGAGDLMLMDRRVVDMLLNG